MSVYREIRQSSCSCPNGQGISSSLWHRFGVLTGTGAVLSLRLTIPHSDAVWCSTVSFRYPSISLLCGLRTDLMWPFPQTCYSSPLVLLKFSQRLQSYHSSTFLQALFFLEVVSLLWLSSCLALASGFPGYQLCQLSTGLSWAPTRFLLP